MALNQLISRHIRVLQRMKGRTAYLCFKKQSSDGGAGSFVSVRDDPEIKELAILTLQKKPVNTVCLQFMKQLTSAMNAVEQDKTKRAVVITSDFPGVFSAGLHLPSLVGKTREEVEDLWRGLTDSWLSIYGSRLVAIAALNGHSVAAGCAYAIACDYRIIADNYLTGITVTRMGIPVPMWLRSQMANLMGNHEAAKAAQLGSLFESRKAKEKGLVDEVVPLNEVLDKARQEVTKWLEVPDDARLAIKQDLREGLIRQIAEQRDSELEKYVALIMQPAIQHSVAKALQRLKDRKGVKPN